MCVSCLCIVCCIHSMFTLYVCCGMCMCVCVPMCKWEFLFFIFFSINSPKLKEFEMGFQMWFVIFYLEIGIFSFKSMGYSHHFRRNQDEWGGGLFHCLGWLFVVVGFIHFVIFYNCQSPAERTQILRYVVVDCDALLCPTGTNKRTRSFIRKSAEL